MKNSKNFCTPPIFSIHVVYFVLVRDSLECPLALEPRDREFKSHHQDKVHDCGNESNHGKETLKLGAEKNS